MPAFNVDEGKLRICTEPNDLWLETWYGKSFLGVGYALLVAIGLALLAGIVLLAIWSPQVRIGIAVLVVMLVIYWTLPGRPSKPR